MHRGAQCVGSICLAAMTATLASGAKLSIPAQVAGPGAVVPIAFEYQGASVSGVQFDLVFDDSAVSLAVVAAGAARDAGKTLYLAAFAPSRQRFIVTGLNQAPIRDGPLVNLFVKVSPDALPGNYPIHFESAIATDPSGHSIAIITSDGSITVNSVYKLAVAPEAVLRCPPARDLPEHTSAGDGPARILLAVTTMPRYHGRETDERFNQIIRAYCPFVPLTTNTRQDNVKGGVSVFRGY